MKMRFLVMGAFTLASGAIVDMRQSRSSSGLAHGEDPWAIRSGKHANNNGLVAKKPRNPFYDIAEGEFAKRTKRKASSIPTGGHFSCGVTYATSSKSERGKLCPASCPVFVQDKTDDQFCSFRCVQATVDSCKTWNPAAPVPDKHLGVCRECEVAGCHDCATDGTDTCLKCKDGQTLSGGKCINYMVYVWYTILAVIGLVVVFVGTWICSLAFRTVTNEHGLERGLNTRSWSKLHAPEDEDGPADQLRELWPLSTNLLTTPVAGNGILHLFNFQFLIIVWAGTTLVAWVALGYIVDTDFFRLGTLTPGKTPRDNCIIIEWGFTTQQRLMYAKYLFVLGLYIFSFLSAVFYSAFQMRRHQRLDAARDSHKDYCAKLTGLPRFSGKDKPEQELNDFMKSTLHGVLGVSICWEFGEKEETLMKIIDNDLEERSHKRVEKAAQTRAKGIDQRQAEIQAMNLLEQSFVMVENAILSPQVQTVVKKQHGAAAMTKSAMKAQHEHDIEANTEEIDVIDELEQLYSTEDAFIVFETEAARDAAVKKVKEEGGLDFHHKHFGHHTMTLEEASCEPSTVQWNKIANRTKSERLLRIVLGFFAILLALALWCFCFYMPYARSVVKADYAHGKDPSPMAKMMFGFVVCGGNVVMYAVCAEVSDRIGFKTQATREVCYMLLYCFSCVFNVVLDLVMAYHMAWRQMVGLGVKTNEGERLGEVDEFVPRLETYAMQKSLGQILLDYSFPATFLIPFLIEPIATVYVPYQLMTLIVRTNPAIVGSAAEAYLASTPMDLSRYADLLLNLILAVMMFFFPGGYLFTILAGLIFSHIVIYLYDHYRVLRSIPACDFATSHVDWYAQALLSIPCGLLLSCAAFKANCHEDAGHCWSDKPVIYWCCALFVGHVILHIMVLLYVVPKFSVATEASEEPYRKCAQRYPCSWFAANPVHCLRSQYIYEHDPPCDFFLLGKEHLLRQNPDLHLFYKGRTPRKEDYGGEFCSSVSTKLKDFEEIAKKKALAAEETLKTNAKKLEAKMRKSQQGSAEESPTGADGSKKK